MEKLEAAEIIDNLASTILSRRDEAIRHRAASGVERRWLEDEASFDGMDSAERGAMVDYATGKLSPSRDKKTTRSKVLMNIIRPKCEQTEGRFADIQLPVDDRNWGLKTTPVPMLAIQAKDKTPVVNHGQPVVKDGQQVTLADLAQNDLKEAQGRMESMENEIDDQLTECGYNTECRKVLKDAVRKGTGILKGPGVVKHLRKVWSQVEGGFALDIVEEHVPYSRRVDPWNVFPDPECGDDIRKAGFIWERDYILPRELRRLMGVSGYLDGQITKILEEEPLRTTVTASRDRLQIEKLTGDHQAYEMWEYHGDLTSDDLAVLQCDCGEAKGAVRACVVFVNDRPIKAVLNLLDTGDLPYDFFQWTQISGSVWGIGLPRMLMWSQRVLTAAWRMMMDNGRNSTRGHVVKGDGLRMADNTGPVTVWEATGDMADVRQAFGVFFFPSNQQELQNIVELALRFVDLETALPMAFAGEQVGPAETLGAVELKIDSSNVALRSRVKLWDDQITRPHLTRYYHWNMQYNESNDIKGDYNVDPRGVSVLLAKDKAAQSILQLLQFRGDPLIGEIIDWAKAVKQLLAAQQVDILKPDEEIEAAMERIKAGQGQGAGQVQAAQIRAQTDLQKEKMRQQLEESKFIAGRKRDTEESDRKREHELKLALIARETKMLELAGKGDMTLQQIKAELAKTSLTLNMQRELSMLNQGARQVARDAVEPAGRARPGRAFEE
jgi:hypothetical protein